MELSAAAKGLSEVMPLPSFEEVKLRLGAKDEKQLLEQLMAMGKSAKGREEVLRKIDPQQEFDAKQREMVFTRLDTMREMIAANVNASEKIKEPQNRGILSRVWSFVLRHKWKLLLGAAALAAAIAAGQYFHLFDLSKLKEMFGGALGKAKEVAGGLKDKGTELLKRGKDVVPPAEGVPAPPQMPSMPKPPGADKTIDMLRKIEKGSD